MSGKGSKRRRGEGYRSGWERIYEANEVRQAEVDELTARLQDSGYNDEQINSILEERYNVTI